MTSLRIALILGVVLGAVGTEAAAQSAPCVLKISPVAVAAGEAVPFSITAPGMGSMEYALFVAHASGTTVGSLNNQAFFLPLSTNVTLVAQGSSTGSRVRSHFIVPAMPGMAGLMPQASAVTWNASSMRVSAAMPWGPILEDSIQ